jgi:hypothetical protein
MKKITLKKRWRLRRKKLIVKIMSWTETGRANYSLPDYEKIQTRREIELINILRNNHLN